eukprot:TRINITY_DN7395_c0_g4_i1.p1 TRINITY_DN7395_c0_g4~~TRINITY_DN7395_c0_g4_i1.p1  ORF type:complete len:239 (+),score=36.46 TRINITY_DN7395_c0_g4_i1:89-805(+)
MAMINSSLSPFIGEVVAPGDVVLDLSNAGPVVRLGSGLRQDGGVVTAVKAGRLQRTKQNKYWISGSQKRYSPVVDDPVIGVVTERRGELYALDIFGPTTANLPTLAFENATRRNRPNLQVGAAVYARIAKVSKEEDPELACVDESGKAEGFGPLTGGYIFDCSTSLARALLSKPPCPVLAALGQKVSFEMAVGLNGRVWVRSASPATTILVCTAIQNAEFLSPTQAQLMVKKLLRRTQ